MHKKKIFLKVRPFYEPLSEESARIPRTPGLAEHWPEPVESVALTLGPIWVSLGPREAHWYRHREPNRSRLRIYSEFLSEFHPNIFRISAEFLPDFFRFLFRLFSPRPAANNEINIIIIIITIIK